MPPKEKRLSLQQKIEVIHTYDKFRSINKAARIFKRSKSYIRNIICRKEEYLAVFKYTRYVGLVVNEWVCRSKLMGNTVSRTQISAIGKVIIKKLKLPEVLTLRWGRRKRANFRSYSEKFTKGKILEQKSLEIDDIIQDLRGVLDDMGYREPVTVESQILKHDEIKKELDSNKLAEVGANQIYSIPDDNCEIDETMNNLKVIKTETIDDVEIIDGPIHANQIYAISDDNCEVEEPMDNLKKTETTDDVEYVDGPIHPNDNTINELELNQSFFDKIRNEKGTNVAAKVYLDSYDKLSCLEVNILHEADLHGLKLINNLKKHLLAKIVDIKKE